MPFAYAGTRRRRNRDRRRAHDANDAKPSDPDRAEASPDPRAESPLARNEGSGQPERRDTSDVDRPARQETPRGDVERGEVVPGIGSQDLLDPGNRDPDAPPVDNRS
ncbi:hypothetical protein [Cupriavidus agavae]|uniref:Uncharacterized protein n=1 Tax=Cupriavidus agavae TaxID=1001822 RepID=A0A4Q7S0J3_9BURK|nr:hypothetical protein [Cupriavidus agavae]RZT39078.1 hypothetical protein EV147_2272 [Cupriavidus agavae]